MPQLRKDPITGRWVIVKTENPMQAQDFPVQTHTRSSRICPFCPGNEGMTPPEIQAYGRKGGGKNSPGWLVRVVPNKFPALKIEENTDKYAIGLYDKIGGFGAHEVIVETPDHDKEISDLPVGHVELVLRAFRDRCLDLRNDPRFKYVIVFKNCGAQAGASLEHPHSQLIALPIIPSRVSGEVKGSLKHYEYADRCIYCDMINQERSEKLLTVYEEPEFLAFTPFVSRFPFETWILPKAHSASFDSLTDPLLGPLAKTLKMTLGKIRTHLNNPAYNLMIHTLPVHGKEGDSFHWHIQIIPRLWRVAGFELGTGFYVNPTPPEVAARTLRA